MHAKFQAKFSFIVLGYVEEMFYFFLSCRMCADCHLPGTLCMWTDCTTCFESCAGAAGECGCLGAGEAGLPLILIMGLIVLGLFTVIGIFYSVLVATMVGQRIWQRHYHILAKRMLTKTTLSGVLSVAEYVVEDVDGEMTESDWSPPPLPPEHVQQLKAVFPLQMDREEVATVVFIKLKLLDAMLTPSGSPTSFPEESDGGIMEIGNFMKLIERAMLKLGHLGHLRVGSVTFHEMILVGS
ncbi:hypothetical protein ACLOJK_013174 [Asimina triloba]